MSIYFIRMVLSWCSTTRYKFRFAKTTSTRGKFVESLRRPDYLFVETLKYSPRKGNRRRPQRYPAPTFTDPRSRHPMCATRPSPRSRSLRQNQPRSDFCERTGPFWVDWSYSPAPGAWVNMVSPVPHSCTRSTPIEAKRNISFDQGLPTRLNLCQQRSACCTHAYSGWQYRQS